MHNVKRFRQTPEVIAARKQREQSKIKEFLALQGDVLSGRNNRDWSRKAFDLTQKLLQLNPEFYTVWNYRRNILLNGIFPTSTPSEINDLISHELSMTMTALKANPKVYWIWNHRHWCLRNIPDGPVDESGFSHGWKKVAWDRELYVVEKMLDSDARNFHAWNYRRYVVASMPEPRTEMAELAYTTSKIESNFSNFSAWHQRSKLYAILWESGKLDIVKSREREFELVKNAIYTDPNDQSAWIYHRWLIASGPDKNILEREIANIDDLLQEQPDSKWCMESLVHYRQLLLRHHPSNSVELAQSCLNLLHQLEELDPPRRQRYRDIAAEIQI